MALQADPTVVYAHGPVAAGVGGQLRIRSPYNTYINTGLPPGPINQPSDSSIDYALYPAPDRYLFCCAAGWEAHLFGELRRPPRGDQEGERATRSARAAVSGSGALSTAPITGATPAAPSRMISPAFRAVMPPIRSPGSRLVAARQLRKSVGT